MRYPPRRASIAGTARSRLPDAAMCETIGRHCDSSADR